MSGIVFLTLNFNLLSSNEKLGSSAHFKKKIRVWFGELEHQVCTCTYAMLVYHIFIAVMNRS